MSRLDDFTRLNRLTKRVEGAVDQMKHGVTVSGVVVSLADATIFTPYGRLEFSDEFHHYFAWAVEERFTELCDVALEHMKTDLRTRAEAAHEEAQAVLDVIKEP